MATKWLTKGELGKLMLAGETVLRGVSGHNRRQGHRRSRMCRFAATARLKTKCL